MWPCSCFKCVSVYIFLWVFCKKIISGSTCNWRSSLKVYWTYYYNWKPKIILIILLYKIQWVSNTTILLMSTKSYQMFICISICYQVDKTHNFFNQNSNLYKNCSMHRIDFERFSERQTWMLALKHHTDIELFIYHRFIPIKRFAVEAFSIYSTIWMNFYQIKQFFQ